MREKNVSLKAIAARVGVSINTVSHALRDMSDISDEMKIRIRRVAIEMGYMPNRVAQTMSKDERPVVALYVNNMANLYFTLLFDEIMAVFRRHDDYNLVIILSDSFDCEMVKKCVLQRVDIIVSSVACDEKAAEYAALNKIGIVYVGTSACYDDSNGKIDCITSDRDAGCRLVARYLSRFHSGKKYVYVSDDYVDSNSRYAPFYEELIALEPDAEIVCFDISRDATDMLYEKISEGYRNFFCYNDMIAYEILKRLDDLVVDVRRMFPDLHIVGCDGLCTRIPGLKQITTVSMDYRRYAEVVYDVVRNRIEQPHHPVEHIVLPVTLHQRKK